MDRRLFARGFQVLLTILFLSVFAGSAAAQGITGLVLNSTTGTPLSGVSVAVYSSTGSFVASSNPTNAEGAYTVTLAAGTYFARTFNSLGFVDQLFDSNPSITCVLFYCPVTSGAPITVGASNVTVNFSLVPGGTVTGVVTNASTGAVVPNVFVNVSTVVFTPTSTFTVNGPSVQTNASGVYAITGLPTRTYYANTFNSQGLVDQVFNRVSCVRGNCNTVALGTPIPVTAPNATANINFPLARGGTITGTVTNSSTGAAAPSVGVQVYQSNGFFAGFSTTSVSGVFSVNGLPTGSYFARTFNSVGLADQLFNLLPCASGCTVTDGQSIAVTAPATTTNVNFLLSPSTPPPGGSITGTVSNATTGLAVFGVLVTVRTSVGVFVGSGTTDASGVYTVPGLASSSYNVQTSNSLGFFNQTVNGVTVTAPSATTVNFSLTAGGSISGTVTNRITGAAVPGVRVEIVNPNNGIVVGSAMTSSTGAYTVNPLGTFTFPGYLARTNGAFNSLGFVDQIFPTYVPVTAPTTTTGVNFALDVSRIIMMTGNYPSGLGSSLAPTSFDVMAFGKVRVGSTATQTFTITNTGAFALTVSSVTYPAGFSGDFVGGVIASRGSRIVTVTFAPTLAKGYSGTITVSANQTGGTNTITVAGNAKTTRANFSANSLADLTVFRPSTGQWFVLTSASGYSYSNYLTFPWGLSGDMPISGDFDGDGITDLAVYRPSNGTWYIRYSSTGYSFTSYGTFQWGLPSDMPMVGDFDGDGKDDLVVYRPSSGEWFISYSSNNYFSWTVYQWGLSGDVPIIADFDGDGIADLTVYRPSTGDWFVRTSKTGYSYNNFLDLMWGLAGDTPLSADFDGDGITDLAVYRPSNGTWYIRYSSTGYSFSPYGAFQWGLGGDMPMIADLDGDNKADLVVYRPTTGEWFTRYSSNGYNYALPSGAQSWTRYQWGLAADIPLGQSAPVPGQ